MQFTSLLATVGMLAASVFAAPLGNPDPPFQITKLTIQCTSGGNTTLNFTVHDPSHYGFSTKVCTGVWSTSAGDYPQSTYMQCGTSSFGWNLQSFSSIQNFQLGLQHAFKDPKVGPYPYDFVDNYAMGNVTSSLLKCATVATTTSCAQTPAIIKAPVYASVAKR